MLWRDQVKPALVLFGLLTLVTGLLYPLLVTGFGRMFFPDQADGNLILQGRQVMGSRWIGQEFSDPGYFWGRPSATSPAYNGGASTGSNLGPSNPALADAVRCRVERLRSDSPGSRAAIPADLLTTSASGLDPHISPAAALFQVPRVARARGVPESRLRDLVHHLTEDRQFWVLGEPRVNVLALNLALDHLIGRPPTGSTTVKKNGTMMWNLSGS